MRVGGRGLSLLTSSLRGRIARELGLTRRCLNGSITVMRSRKGHCCRQLDHLRKVFRRVFRGLVDRPLFVKVASVDGQLATRVSRLISLLGITRDRTGSLGCVLGSPPTRLLRRVFQAGIDIRDVFGRVHDFLCSLGTSIRSLSGDLVRVVSGGVPRLFRNKGRL